MKMKQVQTVTFIVLLTNIVKTHDFYLRIKYRMKLINTQLSKEVFLVNFNVNSRQHYILQ